MKKTTNLYSIIGISLVLFLLGTIGWLFINGHSLSQYFKENVLIQVVMNDNTRPEKARELESILQKQHFVKSVQYISKEDAYAKYVLEKGEDPMEDGLLSENPFYISLDLFIQADYVQADSIALIEKFITQSNIVREVIYDKAVVSKLDSNLKKIGIVLGIIAIILFISVVIIIDNTVKLAMFSNRMLIKTMQMVGATRWFIAKPFDFQALSMGFFSSLVAIIGLLAMKYGLSQWIPESNALSTNFEFIILCISIMILGLVICFLSTHRSVFKYLKVNIDKLY